MCEREGGGERKEKKKSNGEVGGEVWRELGREMFRERQVSGGVTMLKKH